MLPTLAPEGDWIVYNRLPYFLSSPLVPFAHPFGRGDLVIASHPLLPERTVGKRIIAMGGDTVEVNPGGLRQGRIPTSAEGAKGGTSDGEYLRVPPGHVWLQGDNLSNSTDSRDYGPVPLALLLARVEGRVSPFITRWSSRWRPACADIQLVVGMVRV
jgi:inner membrane protease subunit 1